MFRCLTGREPGYVSPAEAQAAAQAMDLFVLGALIDGSGMESPTEAYDPPPREWGRECALLMALYPSLDMAKIGAMSHAQYAELVKAMPEALALRNSHGTR